MQTHAVERVERQIRSLSQIGDHGRLWVGRIDVEYVYTLNAGSISEPSRVSRFLDLKNTATNNSRTLSVAA